MDSTDIVQLGEIASISKGRKASNIFNTPGDKRFRYLQIDDVRHNGTAKFIREDTGTKVKTDDLVIVWDGAYAGLVGFNLDGYIGSTLARIRFNKDKLFAPYFGRFLQSQFNIIKNRRTGATIPHVSGAFLKSLQIPLPPLKEQKRIAAILDKADTIRRKRQNAIKLLDDLLRSIFLDMFGDPVTNPKGWDVVSLGDELCFMTSGSRGWAKYYADSGAIFIRIQNLKNGELDLQDVAYVNPPNSAESKRTLVKEGDLLLSITADLGRTAVVPPNIGEAYINQHLAILRLKSINPIFASHQLATSGGQHQFTHLNRSAVKAGMNFDDIKRIKLLNPPIAIQEEFVIRVKNIIDIKQKQQSAAEESDNLFNSLVQKVFYV